MKNMIPKPEINPLEYDFAFQSYGTAFLFEDIVVRYYNPPGDSLTFGDKGRVRVFLSKNMIADMLAEGAKRTVAQTNMVIGELDRAIDVIKGKDPTEQNIKDVFDLIAEVCRLYRYFDPYYWDGIFGKSIGAENIKLVQDYKNVARIKLNDIFFGDRSYLIVAITHASLLFGVPVAYLNWYRFEEIVDLFSGNDRRPDDNVLKQRQRAYVFVKDKDDKTFLYIGDEAEYLSAMFDGVMEKEVAASEIRSTIKGVTANIGSGKVRGRVRIIRRDYGSDDMTKRQMAQMRQGEVLVSETTDPDLMEAFKKAVAVITDLGGMLSHAAITSRELNLPCIVNTRMATRMLKDGDLVEVDAQRGVISIIK